jgi:hypothetical protein
VLASVKSDRAKLSEILAPGNVRAALEAHLLEIGRAAGIPERDPDLIMVKLRDYMHANSYSVNSRNITFGTPAAITGTGTGAIHRLTVDQDNYSLEGVFLEAKRAECRLDQGQTDKHAEVFEFRGVESEQDFLSVLGSGMRVAVTALHAGATSTGAYVQNPSFETYTGTAPAASTESTPSTTTDITGWTLDATTNVRVELDTTYRGYPGEPADLYSVRFVGNAYMEQILNDTVRPTFDPLIPMYCQVAIYRASTVTGNVSLTFGNVTETVALGSLSDNAWNIVKIDVDQDAWYKTWRKDNVSVKVQLASYGGSGHIKIDDVVVGPYTNVDGTWYAVVGGATPFEADDYSTWTDALAGSEGIVQHWFWRSGLGVLPSNNGGTETITDPS